VKAAKVPAPTVQPEEMPKRRALPVESVGTFYKLDPFRVLKYGECKGFRRFQILVQFGIDLD